jgi:hypothetical protein
MKHIALLYLLISFFLYYLSIHKKRNYWLYLATGLFVSFSIETKTLFAVPAATFVVLFLRELWIYRREKKKLCIRWSLFAAGICSTDIEETSGNASCWRRRTNMSKKVMRGSRKQKPITPPLEGKGLHTLLFLMQQFPHGVLDTSAESIPNFGTKNKVVTHFIAALTQFSTRLRREMWVRGRKSERLKGRTFRAGL